MTAPIQWKKHGLVFSPKGEGGWMHTHAQVPTALVMKDRIRVFFAARPKQDLSLPGFVDLDAKDPAHVLAVHSETLMDVGAPGSFDQHGVMPSCVLEHQGRVWMYYSGWCREVDVPYNNTIGLAVSSDGGKRFERMFAGPIVGRSRFDPFNASSPCVLHENGAWHMWYSSGTGFHETKEKYEPVYLLRYTRSTDGINWQIHDDYIMPLLSKGEAQTRPTVIRIGKQYHMWFCFRGSEDYRGGKGSYTIGYASSADGITWKRDDASAGIARGTSGWDSAMMAYPYVVSLDGGQYVMFYNGNDFGREGFGIATGAAA